MRLGYSFWGFLGNGIADTPDGGRSHRLPFVHGLERSGFELVFLQTNRDSAESREAFPFSWDDGLPQLGVLFLEWRWVIAGRNDTACGSSGHTCDLHRQEDLLNHYTRSGTPTIIWDKDQRLPFADPLRMLPNVRICEAAFLPRCGATTLLFPVADSRLDDGFAPSIDDRIIDVVYIGNQYNRDEDFTLYIAPLATHFSHLVAGKWPRQDQWPHVNFCGRLPYQEVAPLYRRALSTVLLQPERYRQSGQFTQRLPEAVLNGCLPIAPAGPFADRVVPKELVCGGDAADCVRLVSELIELNGTPTHKRLLSYAKSLLEPFRLSRQITIVSRLVEDLT